MEGEYTGGGSDNLISALGSMDLNNWGIRQAMQPAPVQSRISLSPNELGFASASFFNGRDFERHQEAKSEYTYGSTLCFYCTPGCCYCSVEYNPRYLLCTAGTDQQKENLFRF